MTAPIPTAIALGSNLGDRAAHLNAAIDALATLPHSRLLHRSRPFETAPVVPHGAPADSGGGPFLNAAAILETSLPPRDLLNHLLAIEAARGRDRSREQRWGPRTLDLDLILYGDRIIDEPGLTIPHPRLHQRLFVLDPLASIAPSMIVPTLGRTIDQLRRDQIAATPGVGAANP